jgi:succinyl-CoA synthetase alpha subunit
VPIASRITPNLYKDSVALMRVAEQVLAIPGVRRATLVMGTPANKDILAEAGLLAPEVAAAGPADLVLVIDADSDATVAAASEAADRLLTARNAPTDAGAGAPVAPRSIAAAIGRLADARLAQISVPGPYAGAEALKAVKAGLHVFLFSDNVPVAEERAVKTLARERGLLVMGPDCGTAIIGGVPLGFANVVRRGAIGIVAASGTGLQEVTSQVHLLGGGISHAIGTGGRDVSAEVGGITMLQGLDLLAADAETRVIVIVSKPPAPAVTDRVLERLAAIGKPAVVLFIGAELQASGAVHPVRTLFAAAEAAVRLAGIATPSTQAAATAPVTRAASQKYVRALFSGGTYCSEAQAVWRPLGIVPWSNVPLDKTKKLADARTSREHTVIDLGEDEFTVGRPHPMIDPATRIERIAAEAADPATAVILLDVVLGWGSHADPAGALAPAIGAAIAGARGAGRTLTVVAFVCGTDDDPQVRTAQEAKLVAAGALVLPSSTAAALAAARLVGATA